MIHLTEGEVQSLIKNLDENKTMLADLVRQLDEKALELSQAEDLIYNQNNEIIDKAIQIKELTGQKQRLESLLESETIRADNWTETGKRLMAENAHMKKLLAKYAENEQP